MLLLFLDSETDGLPTNRYAPFTATECWPRLIQLSWQVVDTETWMPVETCDYFVKTGAIWKADAERIHKIPEGIVQRFGLSPAEVLGSLASSIQRSDKIVCHNLAFDKNVILAEMQRLYESGIAIRPMTAWCKPDYCTMISTKSFCNIKFKDGKGLKFPRLEELYSAIFGHVYDVSGADLHNSANDVSCLVTCVKELVSKGLLQDLIT